VHADARCGRREPNAGRCNPARTQGLLEVLNVAALDSTVFSGDLSARIEMFVRMPLNGLSLSTGAFLMRHLRLQGGDRVRAGHSFSILG
jgi:hypothetical protein